MASAIVSGALANKPLNGGEAWVRLAWVLGLDRLGFETYFVEQIGSEGCVDERGDAAEFEASVNRAYFESVMRDFGLHGRASLLCDGGDRHAGLGLEQVRETAAGADVLFNLSGHLRRDEILAGPRTSIYVDLDPGFTQAWHADPAVPFALPRHDHYATVGLNVGAAGCPVPTCGREWIPTLPPIVLEQWPEPPPPEGPPRFTTVATWRSPLGTARIGDRVPSLKHHQFRRLIELPGLVEGARFEIALDIHPADAADLEALTAHGWTITDPRRVATTPQAFRAYLRGFAAEFSVAQGVYAETGSGWFSDRSAAYLASGRPVLVQDTGIGAALPRGEGLLTFAALGEAASGAARIAAELPAQAAAARRLAASHLDSDLVLGRLLSAVGVGG